MKEGKSRSDTQGETIPQSIDSESGIRLLHPEKKVSQPHPK